jgi:hypothetical protein
MTNTSMLDKEPYNAFEHLYRALFFPKGGVVMAITGYFDESYNHPTKSDPEPPLMYTVAGYISTVEKWDELIHLWNDHLQTKGVQEFHLTDYEKRKGVYEGWSNEERIAFYGKLQQFIRRKTLKGFAMSLRRTDYDEVFTGMARERFGSHHTFLVLMCMAEVTNWLKERRPDEQVLYVFEKGFGFEGEVAELFKGFAENKKNSKAFRLSEPEALAWGSKNLVPLQAADINAGESNKLAIRGVKKSEGKPVRDIRISLQRLAMSPHDYKYWRREDLVGFVEDAKEKGWI